MTGLDVWGGLGFAAVFLVFGAWRLHRHERGKYVRMWMFLAGSVAVTFSAAIWAPGIYHATSHGVGLFVLGAGLAWGLFDFVLHVPMKDKNYDARKTAYAAVALGIAGMLTFANLSGIEKGIKMDVSPHGYTQVVSRVENSAG